MSPFSFLALLGLAIAVQPEAVSAEDEQLVIPWQAQIYSSFAGWSEEQLAERDEWDLAHKCGGSLIAPGWVLTAAHCINHDRIKNGHRVRLGASTIDLEEGATYRIDRMVRHLDWDKDKRINDIALVHFVADEQTIKEDAGPIEAIELYDGPPLEPGVPVVATGWGQAEEGKGKGYQPDLSWADLSTVDCSAYENLARWTTANQLCAIGREAGDDTCEGDSGGPLVVEAEDRPLLVGIVNYGFGCYRANSPGVYLRVDRHNFRDWIARAMAADPSVSELR